MQPSLDFNQRFANVTNAFAVRKGHVFDGKCICLVDDVMTTGATLNECARVLKQAGAKAVYSFVIAVAGQKIDT
jgi:predicted amidophosphoribosyltransferase